MKPEFGTGDLQSQLEKLTVEQLHMIYELQNQGAIIVKQDGSKRSQVKPTVQVANVGTSSRHLQSGRFTLNMEPTENAQETQDDASPITQHGMTMMTGKRTITEARGSSPKAPDRFNLDLTLATHETQRRRQQLMLSILSRDASNEKNYLSDD